MNNTTIEDVVYNSNSTIAPSGLGSEIIDDAGSLKFLWTSCLVGGLVFFTFLPYCYSKRARKLCWRRIVERRWIEEDSRNNQWYIESMRRRQEERRRQMEERQRQFELSRTQEDEIREGFLRHRMNEFTICISEEDIIEGSDTQVEISHLNKVLTGTEDYTQSKTAEMNSSNHSDGHDSTDIDDVEAPGEKEGCETDDELDILDFQETNSIVCIPAPGRVNNTEKSRNVRNGCAICLSKFEAQDSVTWSSNKECCHAFHAECCLHWFLAVGRKAQAKRLRRNPEMSEDEALAFVCKFPILCPCCRQPFLPDLEESEGDEALTNETAESPST